MDTKRAQPSMSVRPEAPSITFKDRFLEETVVVVPQNEKDPRRRFAVSPAETPHTVRNFLCQEIARSKAGTQMVRQDIAADEDRLWEFVLNPGEELFVAVTPTVEVGDEETVVGCHNRPGEAVATALIDVPPTLE